VVVRNLSARDSSTIPHQNWAGNLTYQARALVAPTTLEELQHLIAQSDLIKALGSRHSFSDIADTTGIHVSLEHFRELTLESNTVRVGAGIRYGELAAFLNERGYALHNMGSLPHISVAGAVAAGTHGSGNALGNLATAVTAVNMVLASGEQKRWTRADPEFNGVVISLGMLGIVTSVELEVQLAFQMRQNVWLELPNESLWQNFDAIFSSAYSVSVFTAWHDQTATQVWVKTRAEAPDVDLSIYGAAAATTPVHPVPGMPAQNCTAQLGEPGPWHERLPHFRMEFTPSSGEELQTEYFVPRAQAVPALQALHAIREHIRPQLQISELRTIASDELWLSPCYGRDSVGLHFTWLKNWAAVREILPRIEAALEPFEVRPHWGKLHTMTGERVRGAYSRWNDFEALRARVGW
jgi:alditol oxidase